MADMDDASSFEFGSEDDELSLEDLGAAYARAAAAHDPDNYVVPETPESPSHENVQESESRTTEDEAFEETVHPEGIIEAALFVGHPENQPFTATRLASLMRDVTEDEVVEMIESLNQSYRDAEQAFRIVEDGSGYRLTLAPAVEKIRESFLGKVREARLSQAAIEVLALVAYQPGVTAQTIQDQRGRESGTLLNQLVRRRLLEVKRKTPPEGGRKVPYYYATERFLALFGLDSLDDLPMVDDSFLGTDG